MLQFPPATGRRNIQTPQPETLLVECFIGARAALLLPFRHSSERDKMGHQQLYWSHPRKFGQGSRSCRVCSNRHGLIRKYGLNMCRQCFRQYAKDIGFVKLD
uniref:Small ribosomal subunit protein uS14 n=1 Tax=Seriola lalandi dorsalis TaxID=1841481 RepID=A0A3B4WBA3_SERLL